jgi:hypothetical protein
MARETFADGEPDDEPTMICPVTGGYCNNWGEPSCDDYGCCLEAGLPPLGPNNEPLSDGIED